MLKRHLCHGFLAKRKRVADRKRREEWEAHKKLHAPIFAEGLCRGWTNPEDPYVQQRARDYIKNEKQREWLLSFAREAWANRMAKARAA